MSEPRQEGFVVLSGNGWTQCSYWSDEDPIEARDAARERLYDLPEGSYWLITIRPDRSSLRRVEVDAEKTVLESPTHFSRFPRTPLSAATKKVVADLRRNLLTGRKVPRQIIGYYLRLLAW